ncbi:hypothetical protein MMC30_000022 [Trapelia coarctata]|nr:hypothetical protein [Trapelia coarctata]
MTNPEHNAGLAPTHWSDIPTSLLLSELRRRQDTPEKAVCGSKGHHGDYNTSLHVFALVLILVLSTGACAFPLLATRFPTLPIPHRFLFLSRHFGTGVLIATAFVHLLPTAFVSLTDPCLPRFWNTGYPAMAGLIAMVACLGVVGVEMVFAVRGAGHVHGSDYDRVPEENGYVGRGGEGGVNGHVVGRKQHKRGDSMRRFNQGPIGRGGEGNDIALGGIGGSSEQRVWGEAPSSPKVSSLPNGSSKLQEDDEEDSAHDSDLDLDEMDPTTTTTDTADLLPTHNHTHMPSSSHRHPHTHTHAPAQSPTLNTPQHHRKLLLQCLLLEAGILFHSIFIGIAVSVSTGPPFVVLLIAISFHQTFEGLALGSRIASINFSLTSSSPSSLLPTSSSSVRQSLNSGRSLDSIKPYLMTLAYGLTTPAGQAIGLAVHNLYDPHGQMGLLMVGVMNAVSAGLLLFAGLVELLAEDFLSERALEGLRGRRRWEAWARDESAQDMILAHRFLSPKIRKDPLGWIFNRGLGW